MLVQNPTIFEPHEVERLAAALQQGLTALNSIEVSSGIIGSSLKVHVGIIKEYMETILGSSKKIRAHRKIKQMIIEIDMEMENHKISAKKREILEVQRTALQSALSEHLNRWEQKTEKAMIV